MDFFSTYIYKYKYNKKYKVPHKTIQDKQNAMYKNNKKEQNLENTCL